MRQTKIFIVVVFALVMSQCSKHQDPTPEEQMIKMLTSDIWTTESVQHDVDGDLTSQYADFAIAFDTRSDADFDGDYYVAGGGRIFPELLGQWKLSPDLSKLILANGREMEVTLTETTLTLIFTVAHTGGRVQGVSGRFTFTLKRK